MIKFTNFSKHYNNNLIIQAPSLALEHGIYWLKGENGSGKTTLIKSIAGLIPFSGSIDVDGAEINKDRTGYRSIVNYAEAEPVYPAFITGNDIIRFYAQTKKATGEQVKFLIEWIGIEAYAGNKIGTYSSGMTKKLSLVLGFMGSPKLILLDEPLITLDQESVSKLQKLIEKSFMSGISFIITSHQEIHLSIPSSRLAINNKTLTISEV